MTTLNRDVHKRSALNITAFVSMAVIAMLQPVTIYYLKTSAEKLERVYENYIRFDAVFREHNNQIGRIDGAMARNREQLEMLKERVTKLESKVEVSKQ